MIHTADELPPSPSAWLVQLASRVILRATARVDIGDEPKLDRFFLDEISLAFKPGPMKTADRAVATVVLASLWGVVIVVIMAAFIALGLLTGSADWVMTGFPIMFGLAFGELVMWGVRWSVAVQRQRATSPEATGEFPTWAATEWLALLAGVTGIEFVIFLANS